MRDPKIPYPAVRFGTGQIHWDTADLMDTSKYCERRRSKREPVVVRPTPPFAPVIAQRLTFPSVLSVTWHNFCCYGVMEHLTPELERRIQVEELWGRRLVLEDMMNASRYKEYSLRRMLPWRHDASHPDKAMILQDLADQTDSKNLSERGAASSYIRRSAAVAAILVFGWLMVQLADSNFAGAHPRTIHRQRSV